MSKRRLTTSDSARAPRFTFFGGKGGVGKTTCAAAFAVASADRGGRVLLLSADPAHSLGDVVRARLSAAPRRIPGVRGRLEAAEIDADRALERWLARRRRAVEQILLRGTFLDEEDVARVMRLSLPGVDELMGLLEIERLAGARDCADVVVDMAPTGHALRLLQMPEQQRHLARVFGEMQAKHRVLVSHLGGRYRTDACDAVIEELDAAGARWQSMLRDPDRSTFRWITLPEPLAIEETRDALASLSRERLPIAELIVNRMTPAPGEPCDACSRRIGAEAAAAAALTVARPRRLRFLPSLVQEPRGVATLRPVGRLLTAERGWTPPRPSPGPRRARATSRPRPTRAAAAPFDVSSDLRVLAFAGKGGVGKTTCAATVATAIATREPRRRLLLLSVDPAHSLGDVFGVRVGDRGRRVPLRRGTLRLRELDAERAFRHRQNRYRRAIDAWLGDVPAGGGESIDDRRLMGRVVDLAPPGIDELFAILTIVSALGIAAEAGATGDPDRSGGGRTGRSPHDLVVLDTAPTGHTIRLLEMIDHARGWVHALLSIFVKYREVARLDEIAADLVEVSRGLRQLDALLKDPARTEFVVVTRAAAVVREETGRLLGALRRQGTTVGAVIVNALTAGTCRRCRRRMAAERREVNRIRQRGRGRVHPRVVLTTPAMANPPRGARQLAAWGSDWTRLP